MAPTTFFTEGVHGGCGDATTAVGPFYCPNGGNIRIDPGFFDELQSRFGAEGGPFAEAWVIAHEYGHRILQQMQGRMNPENRAHGSSAQRRTWSRVGLDGGDPTGCDTFNTDV
ncbi:MAG: neutral zinc metallopeptidase [Actinomycetota bacterium]